MKDVLAFLRLLENPRDRIAGFRVLQLLPGVGPKTAARTLDALASPMDPAARSLLCRLQPVELRSGAAFVDTFNSLRAQSPGWPAELELVTSMVRAALG